MVTTNSLHGTFLFFLIAVFFLRWIESTSLPGDQQYQRQSNPWRPLPRRYQSQRYQPQQYQVNQPQRDHREGGTLEWTYHPPNGPDSWASMFPQFCSWQAQSPIDLNPASAKPRKFGSLKLQNYEIKPRKMKLENNGHTAELLLEDENVRPFVEGGPLKSPHLFRQLHFHWGSNNGQGSEHTVQGKRFPMEMHVVHFNSKYPDLGTAVDFNDGVTVLGFFFEIQPNDNEEFEHLVEALTRVRTYPSETELEGAETFPLSRLFLEEEEREEFYNYQGSLTTPTCNEVVTWIVFQKPLKISEKQMARFRELTTEGSVSLSDNFRPVQPLNRRTVYVQRKEEKKEEEGDSQLLRQTLLASTIVLVPAILVIMLYRLRS